jgi:hypothetical protein
MPDDPKSFRDQLTDQLASDSTDAPALMQLIALVLMNEVLPLLDEIANRVRLQRYRLGLAEMALAELHTIYGHLQDIVPHTQTAFSRRTEPTSARS